MVVDTVCFRPYAALGDKSLSQVIRFEPKEQQMIEEAARRLSAGTDPESSPSGFSSAPRGLRSTIVWPPGVITENFYRELARR